MDLSLNQFIVELYRDASRMPLPAFFDKTLAALREWVPFQSAVLFEYHAETKQAVPLARSGADSGWLSCDAMMPLLCEPPSDGAMPQIMTHSSLMSHQQHQLALRLGQLHDDSYLIYPEYSDTPALLIWLRRPSTEQHFTERDRLMAEWLLPHIIQAVRLIALTGKYQVSLDVPVPESPLEIHLDRQFNVVWCGEYIKACIRSCENSSSCCLKQDDQEAIVLSETLVESVQQSLADGIFEVSNLVFDVRQHNELCVLRVRPESIQNLLTRREQEIASSLALGMSYKEVARELSLSPSTITNYANRIYKKLNIHSKSQLAHLYTLSEAENLSKNVSC